MRTKKKKIRDIEIHLRELTVGEVAELLESMEKMPEYVGVSDLFKAIQKSPMILNKSIDCSEDFLKSLTLSELSSLIEDWLEVNEFFFIILEQIQKVLAPGVDGALVNSIKQSSH